MLKKKSSFYVIEFVSNGKFDVVAYWDRDIAETAKMLLGYLSFVRVLNFFEVEVL